MLSQSHIICTQNTAIIPPGIAIVMHTYMKGNIHLVIYNSYGYSNCSYCMLLNYIAYNYTYRLFLAGKTEIKVKINVDKTVMEIVDETNPKLQKLINIQQLFSHLIKYNVLAQNEREYLGPDNTSTDFKKVQYLLFKLTSKGQEGQENFLKALYESSKEEGNTGHREIIELFKKEGIDINEMISEQK